MLGVDIDGDSLIVVEAKETSSGAMLFGWAMAEVPHDLEGDMAAIATLLGKVIASRNLSGSQAVTTIEGQDAFAKHISLPQMPTGDMDNAVWWEAERTSPFPLGEAYFGYHMIKEVVFEDGTRKVDVLSAAVKKETLRERLKMLREAELEPVAVTVRAWAVVAAMREELPKEPGEVVALVDIGRRHSTLIVMEEGHISFIREMRLGDADFTDSIREELGVSAEAAELLKRKYGIALKEEEQRLLAIAVHEELEQIKDMTSFWEDMKETAGAGVPLGVSESGEVETEARQVAVAVRYPVERLVGELERSIGFWHQQNPQKRIGEFLITGRGALLRDIERLLSARLGAAARVCNPIAAARLGSPTLKEPEIEAVGTALTAAYGMTRREAVRHINLLPSGLKRMRQRRTGPTLSRMSALFAAAVVSLVVALYAIGSAYYADAAEARAREKSLAGLAESLTRLQERRESLQSRILRIEEAWGAVPHWHKVMHLLSLSVKPGELWLRLVSFEAVPDGNGSPDKYLIRVEGYSYEPACFTEFALALARTNVFTNVKRSQWQPVVLGNEDFQQKVGLFSVTCELAVDRWKRLSEK